MASAEPTIQITTEDWAPFNYPDENGKIVGQSTEKIHAIFALAGIDYQISMYPWARAYHLASTQPDTGIYTIMQTPEREPLFQWVCPLQSPTAMYFYRLTRRKDIDFETVEGAKNYRIGVARDEVEHQFLKARGFIENKNFDVTSNDNINLNKLLNNRVDLVMETEHTIGRNLEKMGRNPGEVTKVLEIEDSTTNQQCLAFSLKTSAAVVTKVRRALKLLNARQAVQ